MQYYVIGPDGNKYGPADVPTLKGWVAENRLNPQSMLEDFNTGQRVPASAVQGLFEGQPTAVQSGPVMGPAGSPYAQPPTPGTVYNPGQMVMDNGQSELTLAWVFSIIGLVVCGCGWIFGPLGIWKANQAAAKGNPAASGPKILGIIATVLGVVLVIVRIALFAYVLSNPGRTPFTP